jgi:hypothetical protein
VSAPPVPRHCERSEAIHLAACRDMDCFVAKAPRNDGVGFWFTCQTARGCVSAFSRHVLPEACGSFRPLEKKRAQGKPGARCTRGLVCKLCKEMRTRAYRSSGGIPAFPARWLDGLLRALPGERAFLPPSPAEAWLLANLAPASRRQDHTTSPYASAALVSHSSRVHRIPPRVRDDRDPPLSSGETGRVKNRFAAKFKRFIFFRRTG